MAAADDEREEEKEDDDCDGKFGKNIQEEG